MTHNKLKLNDEKTALFFFKEESQSLSFTACLWVGNANVPFVTSMRNLGYIMSLDEHVSHICILWALEDQLHSPYSISTTKILMCSFVLDHCNSLLAGCPQNLTDMLQKVHQWNSLPHQGRHSDSKAMVKHLKKYLVIKYYPWNTIPNSLAIMSVM